MTSNSVIGRPVLRIEDGPLIRGHGRFVDDLKFPGLLEAAFVRSPHGHAGIRGIDAEAARRLPGVHAVLTFADIRAAKLTAWSDCRCSSGTDQLQGKTLRHSCWPGTKSPMWAKRSRW